MARLRWLLVSLVGIAGIGDPGEARAQLIYPVDFGVVTISRGVGFRHHRHHFGYARGPYTIGIYGPAYYGPAYYAAAAPPYGVVTINRTIVVAPPTIVVNSDRRAREDDDVAGIDLDEIDPRTMKPRKHVLEKKEVRRPEVMVPPRIERGAEEKKLPRLRPIEPLAEDDGGDLSPAEAGKRAFAKRAYGLAAQHFQLAAVAAPRAFLPHFMLAQAQLALGKYRDAVRAIHAGMDLKKDWPTAKFAARELYRENDIDFLGHVKRLEDLLEKRPDDPDLLFLLGYELWFDGQRAKARTLFEKAKKNGADPAYIDPFLKAADLGPIVAR
jgi:hypothetical protein